MRVADRIDAGHDDKEPLGLGVCAGKEDYQTLMLCRHLERPDLGGHAGMVLRGDGSAWSGPLVLGLPPTKRGERGDGDDEAARREEKLGAE